MHLALKEIELMLMSKKDLLSIIFLILGMLFAISSILAIVCICYSQTKKELLDTKLELLKKQSKYKKVKEKQAFKIVSEFIKKYYPFRYGKSWDKKHGKIDFTLGAHALEEWIDYFADDEVDIETFKKEIEK